MSSKTQPNEAACVRIVEDLKPRRRKAKQHPLSAGDTLTFDGPSLRPDVFPAFDDPVPGNASPSALPRRPVSRPFLDTLQHAPPTAIHRLTLRQPIQTGKDHFPQVWTVVVEEGGRRESAVLKLFVEALFPYPPGYERRAWVASSILQQDEADS